jgi:outer membrane biogenesis lipoprotein LolB
MSQKLEVIDRAYSLARRLSYNDKVQAPVKQTLHELCNLLGTKTLHVCKKKEGLLLVNGHGQSRFLTVDERLLYRVFGVVPPIDGWRGNKK